MEEKIQELLKRFDDIEAQLGSPDVVSDQKKYKELTSEHAYLLEIKETWTRLQTASKAIVESQSMLKTESDPEMLEIIKEEITTSEKSKENLQKEIETLLVPPDPRDHRAIIIELRAGTGGDEAAIFVGDCVRMYKNYAVENKWSYELLTSAESDVGGFKEYIMVLSGKNVFRFMQYEAGTHRVQRVPVTETQGRVHTSAITVAILLEPVEKEQVKVDEKDLKIDTYRASGAGGQHVNTTDSAVRVTHIPTGTVVYCQEERSQHKNKDKCMRLLNAKLAEAKRRKEEEERSSLRSSQVGSGDRSERIRTYNFPQNRVTDHRIDLTLYKLDQIMEGNLSEITQTLVAHFHDLKLRQS
ncbi:peptide chain release factor 1 [Candidatus Aerophobetes bacterium]|uniref:Peptide chain release factor 1 n=1 Tax=Aerophobetes bacterium TaxID=2030807 RepID=A0A2A4YIU4_UNCAE|nr:MAG: peptide chain release factor 1 [Candidatus Aerophobetes bacterium]